MVLQRILESVRSLLSPPHRWLMVRSAILWGLGDVGAQAITHYSVSDHRAKESEDKDEEFISFRKKDAEFKIDWFRVYCTSGFGLSACIGPAAYYRFIKSLQSSMYGLQPSTPQLVASTVLDDLPIHGFLGSSKPCYLPIHEYVAWNELERGAGE